MTSVRGLISRTIRRGAARVLPHEPDVMGLLIAQAEITIGGMSALVAWAEGEEGAGQDVRDAEHEADERKRALWLALRDAFITPLAGEDIFFMSAQLDTVLGGAKDAVREAEVLGVVPDLACRTMVVALAEGVGNLLNAFEALSGGRNAFARATSAADVAHKTARQVERTYREAMAALLAQPDQREVAARREVYRRLESIRPEITRVADRVWYVAVKEG